MENYNFKDYVSGEKAVSIVFRLLDEFKCASCNLVLTPEVLFCGNGHAICASCKASLCPTCGRSFTSNQSNHILLSSILQHLPRECRNNICPDIVMPQDTHEDWCGYKITDCKLGNCRWNGPRKDIITHVEHNHSDIPVLRSESESLRWENFNPYEECKRVWPMLIRGQFFWSVMKNDLIKKILVKEYILVPNGKTSMKIRVKVVFQDQQSTTTNVSEKNLCISPFPELDKNPIIIATSILQTFIDRNRVLGWTEIFTVEDPELKLRAPPAILKKPPKTPVTGGVKVFPNFE